jgi:transglutaminase-like putative cysteine protease
MQVRDLPLDILPYLLPSRFVPSDELATYAMREFAGFPNGHIRVSMICGWIYQNIEYRPGSSDSETTATETLIQRAGVCRDFAHLGIAFCRALGIPAPTNRRAAADPVGEFATELLGPAANGFMADDDPARSQHFLDHPQAQREPKIQPNRVGYHLGREAMATIKRITSMVHDPK